MALWKVVRLSALALGYPLLLVLVLAIAAIGARWVQVRVLDPGPGSPHAEQKRAYLAALPRVDPAIAPSFVVVFFDDLGWGDLSSYGNRMIRTPRIDRAAAEGLRMTHFYSASPVCTPSRAALLTGRLPPRTRTDRHVFFPECSFQGTVRRMLGWANALPADEITLAESLGAAGCATGMVGKWHLGDRAGHGPNDFGFQSFFGVQYSNDMQPLDLCRDREIVERDTTTRQSLGALRHEDLPVENRGVDQGRPSSSPATTAPTTTAARAGCADARARSTTVANASPWWSAGRAGSRPGGRAPSRP